MGSCLSKKNACAASSPTPTTLIPTPVEKPKPEPTQIERKNPEQEPTHVKKEIFVIKHRKSHEIDRQDEKGMPEIKKIAADFIHSGNGTNGTNGNVSENVVNGSGVVGVSAGIRTSSCTKEELDAILIQCGRLSRSSSTGKGAESGGRKYAGSKRSYDFDNEGSSGKSEGKNVVDAAGEERENRRRNRQSPGRRRTPSRERDQRSGSRERGGGGSGGRRVSRSPIRRSESPGPNGANSNSNPSSNAAGSKPGKMVSVPATVSSLAMDKSTNGEGVKRIQVKRNVGGGDGGARTGASPRARSPARTRANESQNPVSLSRSNSRKAEHSPYRRNPLGEIDTNVISQAPNNQKPNPENRTVHVAEKKQNTARTDSSTVNANSKKKEQQASVEETKVINVISSGPESLKPHTITRTRSSRLSRDLDINPETLSNTNYTTLLLEDIQNFHQKNTIPSTNTPPAFSLPPCVTKACSILDAVADLNSSTGSNLSTTFSEELRKNLMMKKSKDNSGLPSYMESEVVVAHDDLMEPSFHKYVTVKRGSIGGAELEEQESSAGSNSFVSSQQLLGSSASSCWEPNSAESTDRWNSSSSSSRSVVKNNEDRIGNARARSRIGSRGPVTAPTAASAAST